MGAYSPAPVVTPEIHARVMREVIMPTINGMAQDGIVYTGFLYAGLMIKPDGSLKCWSSTAAWATRKRSRS
jgi:phosphoribosylamine--glycine ligase